jgi:hypothetical protein
VNLAAQLFGCQLTAKKDRFYGFAKLSQGFIRRVLGVVPRKATQEAFRVGHSQL